MAYYDYFHRRPTPRAAEGATRKTYGNTWWGKQWLEALSEIDYSNRLPRGKTYANKGLVSSLEIKGNTISAHVRGSAPRPYHVEIQVQRFKPDEQKRLLDLVSDSPLFLSKLLNREMPPELNAACENANVAIFPKKWSDINGHCSCPDWAVPCKHMAAVFYVVANEIDKNPFTVFALHDFDLLTQLQKSGFSEGQAEDIHIISVEDLQQPIRMQMPNFQFDEHLAATLDFSLLPVDGSHNLLRLLSDKPVFFPEGNFKKILGAAYKTFMEIPKSRSTNTDLPEEDRQIWLNADNLLLLQDLKTGSFIGANLLSEDNQICWETASLAQFIHFLERIPPAWLAQTAPHLRYTHLVFQFAARLIEQGAIVPQLLQTEKNTYRIRFLPALLNEEVRGIFEQIKKIGTPAELNYIFGEGEDIFEPIESDALSALISLFLQFLITDNTPQEAAQGLLPRWFFSGEPMVFDKFEYREYPKAIQLWLSRFFIAEKNFVPIFEINDDTAFADFEVSVRIEDKTQPLSVPASLDEVFSKKKYAYLRLDAVRDLSTLSDFFPPLAAHLNSKGREKMLFNSTDFVSVFFDALPVLRLFGIRILLPKALQKMCRPTASLTLSTKGKITGTGLLSFASMIDFQWQIALGDQILSPQDFLKMVKQMQGIVRLANGYAFLDEKEIAALLQKIETTAAPSPIQLLQIALTENYQGTPVVLNDHLRHLIHELTQPAAVPLPTHLKATLRPYQIRGYEWLYKNARLGFGSLIADDMGLGKTLQVIATLARLREENTIGDHAKALVVVPTTLLTNWQNEIQKFAPTLRTHTYHGPARSLAPLTDADLLLTTYGVLRSEVDDLNKHTWAVAIIDEAQNIKNIETAQSKAVKKIKSALRIAMTGTPVENRMSEYFSIFDFANQGLLGNLKKFTEEFAKPIELQRNQYALHSFKKITAPFLLRRVKTDKTIISDLPDKIETNQFCTLSPEQVGLYENVVNDSLNALEDYAEQDIQRQGLVLKMMTSLKQVCNHPAHFLKNGKATPALSGKTQMLLDLLGRILENGEKTLIFTQYKEMGDLLLPLLKENLGIEALFLHGGCSRKQRDHLVEHFQHHHAARILLLSLKAGGTGLNLTAASNVIHYDLWWNPAVEAQATDRAFRIGQQHNVQVHRFITQGTLEEKIDQMIQKKKELANLTIASGEKWIGELSNAELRDLVSLR